MWAAQNDHHTFKRAQAHVSDEVPVDNFISRRNSNLTTARLGPGPNWTWVIPATWRAFTEYWDSIADLAHQLRSRGTVYNDSTGDCLPGLPHWWAWMPQQQCLRLIEFSSKRHFKYIWVRKADLAHHHGCWGAWGSQEVTGQIGCHSWTARDSALLG